MEEHKNKRVYNSFNNSETLTLLCKLSSQALNLETYDCIQWMISDIVETLYRVHFISVFHVQQKG
jgi:hypothetical protein